MRTFMIVKVKCKTREIVYWAVLEAASIEQARLYGESRYGESGYFVGAQSMFVKETL